MTNGEVVDLVTLGVPVKSHSSSLNEAYADMVRRRAVRDGLTRPSSPRRPSRRRRRRRRRRQSSTDEATPAAESAPTEAATRPAPASTETAPARAHDRRAAGRRAGRGRSRPRPGRGGRRARAAGSHRLVGHRSSPTVSPPTAPTITPAGGGRRAHADPGRRAGRRAAGRPPRPSRRPPPRPSASPPPASRSCREPAVATGLQRRSRRVRRDREGHLVGRPTSRPGRRRPRGPHAGSGGRPHRSRSAPGNGRRPGRRPRRCTAAARPSDVADGQADPAAPGSSAVAVGSADPAASRQRPTLTAAHDRSRPAHHRSGRSAPRRSRRSAPGRSRWPSRRLHARWRPPRRSRRSGGPGGGPVSTGGGGPRPSGQRRPPRRGRSRRRRRDREELQPQFTNYTRSDAPVPDGRRRHRARRVGPGVRSQAEPHRRPTSSASCSTTARWSRPR